MDAERDHFKAPHYSQCVCRDGAAILRGGIPMTPDQIVAELNATAEARAQAAWSRFQGMLRDGDPAKGESADAECRVPDKAKSQPLVLPWDDRESRLEAAYDTVLPALLPGLDPKCRVPEPVAFEYHHEDTGQIGYVDHWQVDNGFFENNPRLQPIGPVYRHPPPTHPVAWALLDVEGRPKELCYGPAIIENPDDTRTVMPLYCAPQPGQHQQGEL